jgi:hypothetical protein
MGNTIPKSWDAKLAFLFIVFLGWTNLIRLPVLYTRFQIPEIIFLLLVISIIVSKSLPKVLFRQPDQIDYPIILYILANIISATFSNCESAWLEVLGSFYLFSVYWVFRYLFTNNTYQIQFKRWFFIAAILAVIPAIFGGVLTLLGSMNFAVWWYPNYPYLGDIYRLRGFMQSPNLLFDFLLISLLLQYRQIKNPFKKYSFWMVILGLVGTFSKSVLLLPVIFSFLIGKRKKTTGFLLGGFFLLIYITSTYFLAANCDSRVNAFSSHTNLPIYENGETCVFPTTYFVLHKAQLENGHKYLPFGAGPGCFIKELATLKEKRAFPSYLQDLEAHSTIFGTYFEIGILGLLALFWLLGLIFTSINKQGKNLDTGIFLVFLFMVFEAIFNDINGFRHYWVILAFYASTLKLNIRP